MSENIWLAIEVFVLILCCLNVIKNLYNITKIFFMQSGKFDLDSKGKVFLACSLSYILTTIILGF